MVKKKRLLLLIDGLGSGGAQKQIILLANCFISNHHIVHLYYYSKEEFFLPLLNPLVSSKRFKNKFHFFIGVLYFKIFYQNNTLSFLDYPNLINFITSIFGNSIVSERNGDPKRYSKFNWRTIATRYSKNVVVNSETTKAYIKRRKEILVINNIHSNNEFEENNIDFKYKHRLSFVVLGSISRVKRPLELYKSIYSCRSELPKSFSIDWYGDIKEEDYYQEIITYLKENKMDSFRFQKANPDVTFILKKYGTGLLVSSNEGSPNALLDYANSNLLITGTPNIGIELFNNGKYVIHQLTSSSILKTIKEINQLSYNEYLLALNRQKEILPLFGKQRIFKKWEQLMK